VVFVFVPIDEYANDFLFDFIGEVFVLQFDEMFYHLDDE
jgi:hypothetical protein